MDINFKLDIAKCEYANAKMLPPYNSKSLEEWKEQIIVFLSNCDCENEIELKEILRKKIAEEKSDDIEKWLSVFAV